MGIHEQRLRRYDPIWREHAFDRVTVNGYVPKMAYHGPLFSFIGNVYSQYRSGPSLFDVADAAGEIFGGGMFGIESCRYVGFRVDGTGVL